MHIHKHFLGAIVVFLIFFTGCSEDSNPANSGGGDFEVTVGSGTTPQYSWSSGDAFSVSVVRTGAPTNIVWGIVTPGLSNIASPATHGVTPSGAVPTSQVETALTAGVEYRVSVSLLDSKIGYTDFTP